VTFEEYLISKRIDGKAFSEAQISMWKEWQHEFAEMHPNSFTAQKLFLINKIRRQFPLTNEPTVPVSPVSSGEWVRSKPIIRPKIN
jgi:hypothetical protein